MIRNRKIHNAAGLLLLLLTLVGCVHRVNGGPPVTAFEKAMAYHATLATTNDELAKAVISAQQMNVISAAEATKVTEAQVKIAKADEQLDAILKQGPQASLAHAEEIKTLIAGMQAAANELTAAGVFGNASNPSVTAITQDAGAIAALGTNLLSTLESAGVLNP